MKNIFCNKKFLLILLIAMLLRIGFALGLGNQAPATHDGAVFDDIAMNILEKGRFQVGPDSPERRVVFYEVKEGFSTREPLYPFFLAFIYKIFGHSFIAARLIEALMDAFTVFLVYIIGVSFFGKAAALLACLIIALYPPFLNFIGLFMREPLLVFLTTILILYLLKVSAAKEAGIRDYVFIGILLGLTALLKAVIVLFFPIFLIGLMLKFRRKPKHFVKASTVSFLSMALVILPWTARNFIVHHKFVPIATTGGINFLLGNNPNASGTNLEPWPVYSAQQKRIVQSLGEAGLDRQYLKWGLMYVREDPLRYLGLAMRKCLIFWFDSYGSYKTLYGAATRIFDAFLLIFGFYGILCSLVAREKYQMLYLYIISITLAHMVFFVVIRNRFLVIAPLALFSAYGVISFAYFLNGLNSRNIAEKVKPEMAKLLSTALLICGFLCYHVLRAAQKG